MSIGLGSKVSLPFFCTICEIILRNKSPNVKLYFEGDDLEVHFADNHHVQSTSDYAKPVT